MLKPIMRHLLEGIKTLELYLKRAKRPEGVLHVNKTIKYPQCNYPKYIWQYLDVSLSPLGLINFKVLLFGNDLHGMIQK